MRTPNAKLVQWILVGGILTGSIATLAVTVRSTFFERGSLDRGGRDSSFGMGRTLGSGSWKIRRDGDSQFLWARGRPRQDPTSVEWFDLTGSPLDLTKFQFGIGKDRIKAIDEPEFVDPDDARLRKLWGGRKGNLDQLDVIGYVHNGDARAYPLQLISSHELVNDTVGGKPVTVGW
jgi:hypothetical protein